MTWVGTEHQLKMVINPEQIEYAVQKKNAYDSTTRGLVDEAENLLELDDNEEAFRVGSDIWQVVDLASKIIEVFHEPQRLAKMSARNLSQAQAYREEVLRERRTQYYSRLREVTERWLDRYVS